MTDNVEDRVAALKAKGEEAAEEATKEREPSTNWNKGLEEGDMLAGVLVRGDKVQKADWNKARYLMEIRDYQTAELFTVWCSNFMLERAIIDQAPAEGSLVVVQYHGKQQSQKDASRSFSVFTVETEKSDFAYWEDIDRRFARQQANRASQVQRAPSFGPDEDPF